MNDTFCQFCNKNIDNIISKESIEWLKSIKDCGFYSAKDDIKADKLLKELGIIK